MKNLKRKGPDKKTGAARNGVSARQVSMDRARQIAIEFCLFNYPTLYTAGAPRLARESAAWVIPVMLEDPDAGISEQVGELVVNKQSGNHTPSTRITAQGKRLYQGGTWAESQGGAWCPILPQRGQLG